MSDNDDLSITLLGNDDLVGKVTNAALNLDAVVEELLESVDVEDLVLGWDRGVDDELVGDLAGLLLL